MPISFANKLRDFPPVRCRLVAVRYGPNRYGWPIPLTDEEIATRSGLPIGEIRDLSVLTSWSTVPWGKIVLFLHGCRVNFDNWSAYRRTVRLARRGKFHYLRRDPYWTAQFEPLVKLWEYIREQRSTP